MTIMQTAKLRKNLISDLTHELKNSRMNWMSRVKDALEERTN